MQPRRTPTGTGSGESPPCVAADSRQAAGTVRRTVASRATGISNGLARSRVAPSRSAESREITPARALASAGTGSDADRRTHRARRLPNPSGGPEAGQPLTASARAPNVSRRAHQGGHLAGGLGSLRALRGGAKLPAHLPSLVSHFCPLGHPSLQRPSINDWPRGHCLQVPSGLRPCRHGIPKLGERSGRQSGPRVPRGQLHRPSVPRTVGRRHTHPGRVRTGFTLKISKPQTSPSGQGC